MSIGLIEKMLPNMLPTLEAPHPSSKIVDIFGKEGNQRMRKKKIMNIYNLYPRGVAILKLLEENLIHFISLKRERM